VDNIRRIQTRGPGHYGRPGSGHPLHRLTNTAQQEKNYRAVCGRSVVGPPPKGKSCDEYPFKSTYEGGTALSKSNRGWAWVPAGQQGSQGGLIKGFYYSNRVLNHDAFYVKV
jgi:Deoxyribonuclease NucA/NucB